MVTVWSHIGPVHDTASAGELKSMKVSEKESEMASAVLGGYDLNRVVLQVSGLSAINATNSRPGVRREIRLGK